jgi:predicted nucleic acid-binding protein
MTASPIFVDTNIPIYAAGRAHPLKTPCVRILGAVGRASGTFITDAQVLVELFVVEQRRGRSGVMKSFAAVMGERVLPYTGEDLRAAEELGAQLDGRLDAADLVHLAVMQRHGITRIITADKAFGPVAQIERLDPARLAEWEDPAWFN